MLVATVWGVNSLLSTRLGAMGGLVKAVTLPILVIMGALHIAIISLNCYNIYWRVRGGTYNDRAKSQLIQMKLYLAYIVLYLVSVLASGILSARLISKLRSKSIHIEVSPP